MTPVQFQRRIIQATALSTVAKTAISAGFYLASLRAGAVIAGVCRAWPGQIRIRED